ncbi:OsmC family protein [Paenilisteria rocourtiae]|uniref:Putative OsmC-like protein n=1 Tax=Listeria rocourtiae TaxID=647910 RepID=A0A4R6ZSR9_9LIST|nr:OsmC family protein [Listeria rocourtiae]EUJ43802.1 OsmC/Ohr family protein [Listeria rocourtiae FSL F6-920]MBC1435691.1 OsmC family protein [Listeria rocourtiae]MBC1605547.1 OsmC family protein [Listeria rocourtiae]TDR55655.1 putative OsmC-like protein [Listeria rocourtiae]
MDIVRGTNGFDVVHENGNWQLNRDTGFSPTQVTVAAVAACSGYVYDAILEKKRIDYTIENIHADFEQDQEATVRVLKKIEVTFTLKVAPENREKAEKALHLVKKSCPVAMSLDPKIEILEKVIFS